MNPREEIVRFCRLAWQAGLMRAHDGNISLRVDRAMLITPSGRSKALIEPSELVEVDIATGRSRGPGRPSSEAGLHLAVYRARDDVGAVVHAHPPQVMAYSLAGRSIALRAMPEALIGLGRVAVVPYATPGSPELAQSAGAELAGCDAVVMSRHGSVTVGRNLEQAWIRTERLEQAAVVSAAAEAMGVPRPLDPAERRRLQQMGRAFWGDPAAPGPRPLAELYRLDRLPATEAFATEKRAVDARGQAHLIVDDLPLRRVCYLTLKAGAGYRGGHYHRHKREGLYIAAGRARVELAAVDSGQRHGLELEVGHRLWMLPGLAHRVAAVEDLVMVEYTDSPYDPADDRPFDF